MYNSYKVGKGIASWENGSVQHISFVVTEDCNLRCKYCYITHKSANKRMNLEVAKKFIDILFSDNIRRSDCVILEFIGGEPLIEIEIIDKITDYFKLTAYSKKDKWYWNYRISICTNGVNYSHEKIQNYFMKNQNKIAVSITLDGIKKKHDLNRVFPNGDGSYDIIIKNISKWKSQFTPSTKVTFASQDLKYLKDSIIHLWNLGITDIASNVVFEDVWKEGDDLVYEKQLIELADYIIDNECYNDYYCTFFDEAIGYPYTESEKKQTFCGAGKMLALGPDGKIYPCIRYKDYSLNNKKEWTLGNVEDGIDMEKVRPFLLAQNDIQSESECLNCEIATGCAFCQGFNYDEAPTTTNFHRTKYICNMHKARVRANNYYFSRLANEKGIKKEVFKPHKKRLNFLLAENYVDFCSYHNDTQQGHLIDISVLKKGLQFAHDNFFDITLVHPKDSFSFYTDNYFDKFTITHIIPIVFYEKANYLKNVVWTIDKDAINSIVSIKNLDNCILNIYQDDIANLYDYISKIYLNVNRININILNIDKKFNFKKYYEQLLKIKDLIIFKKIKDNIILEINVITDLLYINTRENCKAGDSSFTVDPLGNIYICPAHYTEKISDSIGSLNDGIEYIKSGRLFQEENNPLCKTCESLQCIRCIYLNKTFTNEVNISPSFQCKKAHIEQYISYLIQKDLTNKDTIKKPKFLDQLDVLSEEATFHTGIYKGEKYEESTM